MLYAVGKTKCNDEMNFFLLWMCNNHTEYLHSVGSVIMTIRGPLAMGQEVGVFFREVGVARPLAGCRKLSVLC